MRSTLRHWIYRSPLYGWTLAGAPPPTVVDPAGLRRPGDAGRGAAVVNGDLAAAVAVRDPTESAFAFHRFDWLADVASASDIAHWSFARDAVLRWIEGNERWHPAVWQVDILGQRLGNWILFAAPMLARADEAFRRAFLARLGRDARHLKRALRHETARTRVFEGARGLLISGLFLPGFQGLQTAALATLERAVARQVLADGGHVSRAPETHLGVLASLVDCRALLNGREPVPDWLQGACDRMAPVLRAWRHRDGRLAVFASGGEAEEAAIERTLAEAVGPGRAMDNLPHSGYQRLASGRTTLIVDTGPGAGGAAADGGGAMYPAPLAFELSHGKDRVIVNCGPAPAAMGGAWREALAKAAAHSTLSLEAGEPRPKTAAGIDRRKVEQHQLIEAHSDGYAALGLAHGRSLYLAAGGLDVRGEDRLTGGTAPQRFAIRFHLHPDIRALQAEGGSVLLRPAHGPGWRFRASGAEVRLEESVYAGTGRLQRSQQIVLVGEHPMGGATVLKWRLGRE